MTTGNLRSCTSVDGAEDARTRKLEAHAEAHIRDSPVRFNGAPVEVKVIVKLDVYADAEGGSDADVPANAPSPSAE